MKYRTDFVTNSSSSSFIIDKEKFDGELTVDGVFGKLKEIQRKYDAKLKAINELLIERGVNGHGEESRSDRSILWRCIYEAGIDEEIEKLFDVDVFWLDDTEGWLDGYETYSDFFAVNKGDTFYISDYRDSDIALGWDDTEVLSWYTDSSLIPGCIYQLTENDRVTCSSCEEAEWCANKSYIETRRKEYGDDNMPIREIIRREILKLGEICIHSTEGHIPFNIVRQLKKLCTHQCNHMG